MGEQKPEIASKNELFSQYIPSCISSFKSKVLDKRNITTESKQHGKKSNWKTSTHIRKLETGVTACNQKSPGKARIMDEREYNLEDLPQIMAKIRFLEEKAEKLFQREYNEKRSASLRLTNQTFQEGKFQLEPSHSAFYPILSYQDMEDLELIDKQLV